MTKLYPTILIALALLVTTTACRGERDEDTDEGQQEEEEEEEEEDGQQEEEGDLPDLPCGGADLMTDDYNCGVCGHECPLWYPGTPYEAGNCNEGVCGPGWSGCESEGLDPFENCAEICDAGGQTCVANGCSGLTALLIPVGFDGSCDISFLSDTMAGSCDEPIPWMTTIEWSIHARCCCE